MLRNLPVLLDGYKLMVTEDPTVKMYEKDGKQVLATDAEGASLYTVTLFVKPPADSSGRMGKGMEVKVTLETDPGEVGEGSRVELVNPRISQWEIDGRAGVSWRATGVKPASPQRAVTAA